MQVVPSADRPFPEALRATLAQREPRRLDAGSTTAASVLVALFDRGDGRARVWLVRRPTHLRLHAGQVALPGGKRDPGDRDSVATALREAEEEIGLPPGDVDVLGACDDFVTTTNYLVTPIVGWVHGRFAPRPNPAEVARAFSAELATFHDEGLLRAIPIPSLRRLVRVYQVDGETVWGATGAMLHELAKRCHALTA